MADKVKVLVAGYRKFNELINSLLPEFNDMADFDIVEFVASEQQRYKDFARRYSADVVISAGSNASYLKATLSVPVLAQPVTDTDVIESIAKARRIASRVHVFTFGGEPGISDRVFSTLNELLNAQIFHTTYTTTDEATESLLLSLADGPPEVVVGPSYICRLAEQRGTPAILMYSKSSARSLLRRAIDVAQSSQAGQQSLQGAPGNQFVVFSSKMERVAELAGRYALGRATVLIEGESGTGKEHIAREIHARSEFSSGPLIAVNCGSISNELFESELFGYVEGAFTSSRRGGHKGLVERANNGVLFLDEVGELPLGQQVKLLRALQERRIRPVGSNREISLDFKVIAATNKDLGHAVAAGEFRGDLYYRLNVFVLRIPPLRERPEDVRAIFGYYLSRYIKEYSANAEPERLLEFICPRLQNYLWPGNIRELQNFAERLVVNFAAYSGFELSDEAIRGILPELIPCSDTETENKGTLRELEFSAIADAMQRHNGNRQKVARYLGISPTTLWRRLQQHRGE